MLFKRKKSIVSSDEKDNHSRFEDQSFKHEDVPYTFLRDIILDPNIFRQFTETIQYVFVVSTPQLVVKYVSPNFEKLYGLKNERFKKNPQSILRVIHPADRLKIMYKGALARITPKLFSETQIRVMQHNGSIKWVWVMNQKIYDKNNKHILSIGISTDITKFKNNQIELERLKHNLEILVEQRTFELSRINQDYAETNSKLKIVNDRLIQSNQSLKQEVENREHLQRLLESSEAKYRSFIQQSMEGIVLISEDGRIIEWNDAMAKIYLLSKDAVLGKYIWDVETSIFPKERQTENTRNNIRKAFYNLLSKNNHETFQMEGSITTAEGLKHVIFFGFQIRTATERFVGRITWDYTKQKKNEAELIGYREHLEKIVQERTIELVKQEQRYVRILEQIQDFVMLVDARGNISYISPSVKNVLGYTVEEVIGKNIIEFTDKSEVKIASERFKKFIDGELPDSKIVIYRLIDKSGVSRHIEILVNNQFSNPFLKAIVMNCRDITERINSNKKLQQNEERFRMISEQTGQIVYEHDIITGKTNWSGAYESITGFKLSEISNMVIDDIRARTHPEDLFRVANIHSFTKDNKFRIEYRLKRKDNNYISLEENGIQLRNEAGELYKIMGSIRDIEPIRLNEKLIRDNEEYFKTFSSIASEGIALLDNEIIEQANEQIANLFGFNNQRLMIGKKITDFISIQTFHGETNNDSEYLRHSITRADGTEIPVEILTKPIHFRGKNMLAISIRDVSLQVENEKLIKDSEANYRSLFEQAVDGILVGINEGIIVDTNPKILAMTGFTKEDIIQKKIGILFPEDELVKKPFRFDLLKIGKSVITERRMQRKDGSLMFVEMNSHQMSDGRYISFIRDVSERYEIQEKIKQSELRLKRAQIVAKTGSWELNLSNMIFSGSEEAFNLMGFSTQLNTISFAEVLQRIDKEHHTAIGIALEKIKQGIPKIEFELSITDTSNNKKIFFNIIAERNSSNVDDVIIFGTLRDITEHKHLDKAVFDAIISTEEKDRLFFAQDLHDELGPLLSSLKLYVSSMSEKIPDDEKLRYIYSKIQEIAKDSVEKVRELSYALSPNIVINFGLIKAIQNIINKNRVLINIHFITNSELYRFEQNIEISCYRIINELITNTLKHSGATDIYIKLHYDKGVISLNYKDNGNGFNFDEIIQQHIGTGLNNIISRLKLLDATHYIHTKPDLGFELSATIQASIIN